MRRHLGIAWIGLVLAGSLPAQETQKFRSGPQSGAKLPEAFDPWNVNGEYKNRPHCLITKYGLDPTVVMVLAREPAAGKDAPLLDLLKKLDALVDQYQDDHYFASFIVFLSPDARGSADDDPEETDIDKLIQQAQAHQALLGRLAALADKLDKKKVVVACHPEGPKNDGPPGYHLHAMAAVTVLVYRHYEVRANFAFPQGKLTDEDVDTMVEHIKKLLPKRK